MKNLSLSAAFLFSYITTFAGTPVTAAPAPTVPTMGEWGVIVLGISLVIIGAVAVKNAFVSRQIEEVS